jgi:nucleoside-diphosphate-sugar epimerase
MKKIIVTGSNGFIGKKVIEFFNSKGFEIIALTSKKINYSKDNIKYIYCPSSNYINLSKLLNPSDIYEGLLHLGWQGTSGIERNNYEIQFSNFINSKILFEIILSNFNIKQVISFGSILEDEFILNYVNKKNSVNNYYGMFKLLTQKTMFSIFEKSTIKYNWLKFIHVYGPGDSENRFIQSTLNKVIKKQELHFSSANQPYDFMYINDAINLIYNIFSANLNSQTLTLTTNAKFTLRNYIDLIIKKFNLVDKVFFDLPKNDLLPISIYQEDYSIIKNYKFDYDFITGINETLKSIENENS